MRCYSSEGDYRLDKVTVARYHRGQNENFRELAILLGVKYLAILGAYFDDSGSQPDPNTPVVGVGGIIASIPQWERFNRQWGEQLAKYKLEYFRMSAFEKGRPPFDKVPKDERRQFLLALQRIIRENSRDFLFSSLIVKEFNAIKKEFPNVKISAYQFCCEQCMAGISNWVSVSDKRKEIAVFFEHGNPMMSEGMKLYTDMTNSEQLRKICKISSLTTAIKKEKKPLQAADMFAYEIVRCRKNIDIESKTKIRDEFRSLAKDKNLLGYWNTPDEIRFHFNLILAARQEMASVRSSFLKLYP